MKRHMTRVCTYWVAGDKTAKRDLGSAAAQLISFPPRDDSALSVAGGTGACDPALTALISTRQ